MMLDAKTLEWLERRKNICTRCYKRSFCRTGGRHNFNTTKCQFWEPLVPGSLFRNLSEDFRDAAEFEARVSKYLARGDMEDVPCAHGMKIFCPRPPFAGKLCGDWCRLRESRLAVEREMIAEGKGPGRPEEDNGN